MIKKNPCIPTGSAFQTEVKTTQCMGGVGRYCWKAVLIICCLYSKVIHLLKFWASKKLKNKNSKQKICKKKNQEQRLLFLFCHHYLYHSSESPVSNFCFQADMKQTLAALGAPHGCFLHSIREEGSKGAALFSSVILKIITHMYTRKRQGFRCVSCPRKS